MSILINNDLIWLSIPRCASVSIENALFQSDLTIKHVTDVLGNRELNLNDDGKLLHLHYPLDTLFDVFGEKETICIKRDWFERWLSGFNYIWTLIKRHNLTPVIELSEVDNSFIYDMFNNEFMNDFHSSNNDGLIKCYSRFVKEDLSLQHINPIKFTGLTVLNSQNYWKNSQKCTYEFDISELGIFENFIKSKFNCNLNLTKDNSNETVINKIIINDKLKNKIWSLFESPFEKKIRLI